MTCLDDSVKLVPNMPERDFILYCDHCGKEFPFTVYKSTEPINIYDANIAAQRKSVEADPRLAKPSEVQDACTTGYPHRILVRNIRTA